LGLDAEGLADVFEEAEGLGGGEAGGEGEGGVVLEEARDGGAGVVDAGWLLEEGGDGEELQEAQAAVEGDEVEALGCDPGLEVCEDGGVVGGDVGVDAVAEGVLPGGGGWRGVVGGGRPGRGRGWRPGGGPRGVGVSGARS
jgi:hypothetical protein